MTVNIQVVNSSKISVTTYSSPWYHTHIGTRIAIITTAQTSDPSCQKYPSRQQSQRQICTNVSNSCRTVRTEKQIRSPPLTRRFITAECAARTGSHKSWKPWLSHVLLKWPVLVLRAGKKKKAWESIFVQKYRSPSKTRWFIWCTTKDSDATYIT